MMHNEYLFTYGWLKRKYHRELPFEMPRTFVGEAFTRGSLYQVADYPGIKLDGTSKVYGEVYLLEKDHDWYSMDQFECSLPTVYSGAEYRRVQTICYMDKEEIKCWIYEYLHQPTREQLIPKGVF